MSLYRILLLAVSIVSVTNSMYGRRICVTHHGVAADGSTLCSPAIDSLIARAPKGSTIHFPAGNYLVGTIHLRSGITLHLDRGATLVASSRLEDYDHLHPRHDMSCYDSGEGTRNANLASDTCWTRALLLAEHAENVRICGRGTIDGCHLPDSLGEEGMRGPHTLLFAGCRCVRIEGIHVRRAANYAVLGYELQHARFRRLRITEGWDGIHVRGGQDIRIHHCDIRTGDDCIAGGYWDGMRISRCHLNSSCNGIRMMEPSADLSISRCTIYGPGQFPHLTSGSERRTGTIYGIVFEPGAWGAAPGTTRQVRLQRLRFSRMYAPIAYSMGTDTPCEDIRISRVRATDCRLTIPFNNQGSSLMWRSVQVSRSRFR